MINTVVKPARSFAATVAALALTGLIAPHAVAADANAESGVRISAQAKSETRVIAAKDPQAVNSAANLCGSGYELFTAERLPNATRLGTLFTYTKSGSSGLTSSCAVFDNNSGSSVYMKLKLCPNSTDAKLCKTDEGTFSQYAGPVRVTGSNASILCSKVTAIMKYEGGTVINRVTYAAPCN
ncbi:hypothetical protein SLV14_001672 [Streptomyces sp. Je 1-4]|uniref:hypothetical protein n=1 Tax=Streptomyces TaxID=1883 RepID=UPI0021DB58B5|nr:MULTISPECIES: hypothetical protein [unclassified Streptomyces]UYB39206.1 hypothetical protein SLV14_001672 [Streptomyces sp. Je 1-4]UZQ35221.1 hypothetical protein SLV14N_001672 [Streptomyces sp. Je 1-4] [Streptomyces sp. Je 1-4 4N24]UZQ42639.1 hypothetical protein SLV14NA_001672 [Streptomyces sp. Je 1-4] [Streptomyces sp. Je 1-4 4N24_ara]